MGRPMTWAVLATMCFLPIVVVRGGAESSTDTRSIYISESVCDLVVVDSQDKYAELVSTVNEEVASGRRFRVGLNDSHTRSVWRWADGTVDTVHKWLPDQPDPTAGSCVLLAMIDEAIGFMTDPCDSKEFLSVCTREPYGSCQEPLDNCDGLYMPTQPRQYGVYPGWPTGQCDEPCARQLCEAYGTTLPRIYNKSDIAELRAQIFSTRYLSAQSVFLDVKFNQSSISSPRTSDGRILTFAWWHNMEPSLPWKQPCVLVNYSGFRTAPCGTPVSRVVCNGPGPQPHCAASGECFWVNMTLSNYTEAQQSCSSSRPGQLAVIDTQDKYDFLLERVPAFTLGEPNYYSYWVGIDGRCAVLHALDLNLRFVTVECHGLFRAICMGTGMVGSAQLPTTEFPPDTSTDSSTDPSLPHTTGNEVSPTLSSSGVSPTSIPGSSVFEINPSTETDISVSSTHTASSSSLGSVSSSTTHTASSSSLGSVSSSTTPTASSSTLGSVSSSSTSITSSSTSYTIPQDNRTGRTSTIDILSGYTPISPGSEQQARATVPWIDTTTNKNSRHNSTHTSQIFNTSVYCPEPVQMDNVRWHISSPADTKLGLSAGTVVVYTCVQSFQFIGGGSTRSLVCMNDGSWHTRAPLCTRVLCPMPNMPNALVTGSERHVGAVQYLQCPPGTRFIDGTRHTTILCTNRCEWTQNNMNCKKNRCPPFPMIIHGNLVTLEDAAAGQVALVRCQRGSRFPDGGTEHHVTCINGRYEELGECREDVCHFDSHPGNATLSALSGVLGDVITSTCNHGYSFSNHSRSESIECLEFSRWSRNPELCYQIDCGPPVLIKDATLISNGTLLGNVATYTCTGRRRTEDGRSAVRAMCAEDWHWSEQNFTCREGRCPPLTVPAGVLHGQLITDVRHVMAFRCSQGHVFSDWKTSVYVMCDVSLTWNDTVGDCIPITCPSVPSLAHANVNYTNANTNYLARAMYTCAEGYFWDGASDPVIQCEADGSWSPLPGLCKPVPCPHPPTVSHAWSPAMHGVTYVYGDFIWYMCFDGFWFSRNVYTTATQCQSDGNWHPNITDCKEITCPPLATWADLEGFSGALSLRTSANVSCLPGFGLAHNTSQSSIVIVCGQDAHWHPVEPFCIPVSEEPRTPPLEAPEANVIGIVTAVVISTAFLTIIVADLLSCTLPKR